MKCCPLGGLRRFLLFNPLTFLLKIVIKCLFLSPVRMSMRNGSYLCLESKLFSMDMWSSLCFSLRIWGTQTPSLHNFSLFSSGGRLWIRSFWSQVLIVEYFCTDCLLPILLEHLNLGSTFNDISPERDFENQFRSWQSIITSWP